MSLHPANCSHPSVQFVVNHPLVLTISLNMCAGVQYGIVWPGVTGHILWIHPLSISAQYHLLSRQSSSNSYSPPELLCVYSSILLKYVEGLCTYTSFSSSYSIILILTLFCVLFKQITQGKSGPPHN